MKYNKYVCIYERTFQITQTATAFVVMAHIFAKTKTYIKYKSNMIAFN